MSVYTVVTAPTEEPVTVTQAKLNARIDGSDLDALLEIAITAARRRAEHLTGQCLALGTWSLEIEEFPCGPIQIARVPLVSVTSVQYVDEDGVTQTLSSALYTVETRRDEAWIHPLIYTDWPNTLPDAVNAVRVLFTAGYSRSACPKEVLQWIMIEAARLVDDPEGARPRAEHVDALLEPLKVWRY